ncbi:MAG: hypothetical protein LJE96_10515 [Deltaproteobacteria bacterium]|nr:hypothetical protein [Deltaproteobacteria bacterium]
MTKMNGPEDPGKNHGFQVARLQPATLVAGWTGQLKERFFPSRCVNAFMMSPNILNPPAILSFQG